MVTSGTGHDRCPSQSEPNRRPDATAGVATKKLAKPFLVSREDQKIFWSGSSAPGKAKTGVASACLATSKASTALTALSALRLILTFRSIAALAKTIAT